MSTPVSLLTTVFGSRRVKRYRSFKFSEALAQVSFFSEPSGFVADHGYDSSHLSLGPIEQPDRKGNRQGSPVLVCGGNPQHIMTVARLPARHSLSVTSPMSLSQTLGNN